MSDSDFDSLLAKLAASPRQRTPLHLVGTRRFELRKQLGSGTFGEVYEARDREHGTRVALKALKSSNPDWIYRFKREFRIVGDLAHPNLVRLFELFVEDERWYLTMELLEGLPFDVYVARAPDRLRQSFRQLALGIAELHRMRCLHRDLKPSNAIVEPSGRVVLLDFGLALETRASGTSVLAGTPVYMAPELGLGQPPSEAGDWYAFGLMLYEALAGKLPYSGDRATMLQQKLGPPPAAPSQVRANVDADLDVLAMRLIHKDPRARATADDVLAVLAGEMPLATAHRSTGQDLVGRELDLQTLAAALARAADAPTVVSVTGSPGIGKSSVVTAFLDSVRGQPKVRVYHGRCLELESVPFKGIDGAIDMLCNDLSRWRFDEAKRLAPESLAALVQMFPMLKRVDAFARARPGTTSTRAPQQLRDAAAAALRELLGNLAGMGQVVLFVDDLQWASDDTVQLLLELLAAGGPRLLLIEAHRSGGEGDVRVIDRFSAGLAEHGIEPTRIDVQALDREAIGSWLARQPDQVENRLTTDRALHETGGHPQLLVRLLALGRHPGDGPVDLKAVLALELEQLDDRARAVLDVVSIAGGPVRPQSVFDAAGIPLDPTTLDQLRRRKLIQSATADVRIEAYHDRVRDVTLARLDAHRRQALHLALAEALERTDLAEPDALARHYREGGDVARALTWTLRAAERASETLAFARAIELYRAAVALAENPEARLDVLQALADAYVQRGLRADAAHTCLDAAALAFTLGRISDHHALRALAGEHFLLAGQLERGFELLRDALAEVGVTLPHSAAVAVAESFNVGGALAARGLDIRASSRLDDARLVQRVDLELAVARSLTQTDLRGPLMAARGLADALTLGEPRRIQRALALFVLNHAARMPDDSLLLAAETKAHALAVELSDEVGVAWAELAAGMHAIYRHEFAQALAALAEAERRFLTLPGFAREASLARLSTIVVCGNFGVDLAHARRRQAGFVDEMLARGDVFSATWGRFVEIQNALSADQPARARALIELHIRTSSNMRDSLLSASVLIHSVAVDLYERPEQAWDTLKAMEPEYNQMFSSMIPITIQLHARVAANCAMAAFCAGKATRVETIARIDVLLDRLANTEVRAATLLVEGHRRLLAGDRAGSIDVWTQAADIWRAKYQGPLEKSLRLRIAELRGDGAGARQLTSDLLALGIAAPQRYTTLMAGRLPP